MSLASSLTISLSGIRAASTMLEMTTNNISNASTEGYSTKRVVTTSASLGVVSGGVQVNGFERAQDQALFTTLTKATTSDGLRTKQDNYLQQVQDLLGISGSDNPPLLESLSDFVNAWKVLDSAPESLVNSRQVVQDAVTFTDELKRISGEVEALDRQCKAEVESTLADLNSYLDQIKDINSKISQAYNSNLSIGDLQDKRDQLVLKVANITSVTVLERGYGQIAVYTASGYQLVDGGSARSFSYDGVDVTSNANPGLSLNSALSGGALEALVEFRATDTPVSTEPAVNIIQKLRSQLDEIADSFLNIVTTATSGEATFAAAYNAAATGAGELASNFFTGTDRTNISVNAALLDGTSTVKPGAASAIVDALMDSTRAFSADGLTLTNVNYTSLVTSSLTAFQQAANNVATLQTTAENTKDYLEQKYTNQTAVNVDTELVNLVTFQNSYAASAHAMSVIQELFATLERLL